LFTRLTTPFIHGRKKTKMNNVNHVSGNTYKVKDRELELEMTAEHCTGVALDLLERAEEGHRAMFTLSHLLSDYRDESGMNRDLDDIEISGVAAICRAISYRLEEEMCSARSEIAVLRAFSKTTHL
jgi:hypothetical protein